MTSGVSVDLVVTNRTRYDAHNPINNGESNCFGLINVKAPSSVELSFRFVKSGTSESVTLPRSLFTVYDIDESNTGMKEAITFNMEVPAYFVTTTSELMVAGTEELTFTSTVAGAGSDNP